MAYETVTVDDFTARFPLFADREPDQIAAILAEAASQVDNRWRAADYKPAILYLTAHLLAMDASQEGDEVPIGPSGAGQVIASESIGGMSVSYFNGQSSNNRSGGVAVNSDYAMTEYGRRYLRLLRLNFGGPVVV